MSDDAFSAFDEKMLGLNDAQLMKFFNVLEPESREFVATYSLGIYVRYLSALADQVRRLP